MSPAGGVVSTMEGQGGTGGHSLVTIINAASAAESDMDVAASAGSACPWMSPILAKRLTPAAVPTVGNDDALYSVDETKEDESLRCFLRL